MQDFVASLVRDGDVQPYEFHTFPAENWDTAAELATKWAVHEIGAAGGLEAPTYLHLKQGFEGRLIRKWTDMRDGQMA